jgi:hypothetical protein
VSYQFQDPTDLTLEERSPIFTQEKAGRAALGLIGTWFLGFVGCFIKLPVSRLGLGNVELWDD